jgi:hypothetical protein
MRQQGKIPEKKFLKALKNVLSLGKDTEGQVEKVLERIPLIGSSLKSNPFKQLDYL